MPRDNNEGDDPRQELQDRLKLFESQPLREASIGLLDALGYRSDRTIEIPDSAPDAFLGMLAENDQDKAFNKKNALFDEWLHADLLFQLTDEELSDQVGFGNEQVVPARLESYLFFAIELKQQNYARGKLTTIARQLNRAFPMPVMVLIKHKGFLSIAVINRRAHRRDASRDVLGKVTIIRDISLNNPHRGHLDILNSFAMPRLLRARAINSFETLHAAWEDIFNVELLNRRFYKDLFKWYFWAMEKVSFPDDIKPKKLTKAEEKTQDEKLRATSLIRLLTRLIFCWFFKEKGLIPEELFDKDYLGTLLKSLKGEDSSYYWAILQNLFFATLNQRMNTSGRKYRKFAKDQGFHKNKDTYGIDNLYRYESLFKDEEAALEAFADIPFLNGGLFDCLDYTDDRGKKIYVDGFSRVKSKRSIVPNFLFFGEGEVDIGAVTGAARRGMEKVRGLIEILSAYKFTIVENTPIDQEVALDPELLGKVFENLLASYNEETQASARKETGSFYTPRPIVEYMVDKSLKAYLADELRRAHKMEENVAIGKLDGLFAYSERKHEFSSAQVSTLIKAIDACKVLDPACGSGAFPMGVLHRLVYILAKLDPDNERWKQTQLDKLDSVPMQEELKSTFDNNDDDYGRKLYLIENCLYGVDIQPIAIQLSKLRFFISLICDQRTNKDRGKNYGVKPLPNLETKFVAADALIGIREYKDQLHLRDYEVEEIEQELEKVRHKYFAAQIRRDKLELQKKEKKLRKKLAIKLKTAIADPRISTKLADWDPYNPHFAADFFDPPWMFDQSVAQGFDLVVGNPPYRRIQNFPPEQKRWWKEQEYQTYAATADIYCLFYEKGVSLLRAGGHLCYITSNKWMRTVYGEVLRNYFPSKCAVREIVDFAGVRVFSSAAVDTSIVMLDKAEGPENFRSVRVSQDYQPSADLAEAIGDKLGQFKIPADATKSWVLLPKEQQEIKSLVEEQGEALEKWDVQINYGVKTGCNEAFYITSEQREAMIEKDSACKDILVPLLRGRFVKRYDNSWDGTWMIATFPALDIRANKLPKPIMNHLKAYREQLEPRPSSWKGGAWIGRKAGSYQWYETQDSISYHEEFYNSKIIYPDITRNLPFFYDENGSYFVNNSAFVIFGDNRYLPYLVAQFNASLFRCCFKDNFPSLGEEGFRLWRVFFEKIPIRKPTEDQSQLFSKLVALMQFTKKNNDQDTRVWAYLLDNIIDACVMECYFHDHMKERKLLLQDDVAKLLEKFELKSKKSERINFLRHFYQTANAPDHPIRNRLIRLTADSPNLLAVIKEYGKT